MSALERGQWIHGILYMYIVPLFAYVFRVSLQGCVVCSHVHVEDRVSLKDCLVGANFTVTREGQSQ